jgi:hypothetical protein
LVLLLLLLLLQHSLLWETLDSPTLSSAQDSSKMQPPINVTTMTKTQNLFHQLGFSLQSPMLLCCKQAAAVDTAPATSH